MDGCVDAGKHFTVTELIESVVQQGTVGFSLLPSATEATQKHVKKTTVVVYQVF